MNESKTAIISGMQRGGASSAIGAGGCDKATGSAVENCSIHCLKAPEVTGETAILVTHSPDGHTKAHVIYYVAALRRQGIGVVLVVAADRPMSALSPETLALFCGLFIRENRGFDFAAWAHVLRLYPVLFSAPILYLLNDSLFGPLNVGKFALLIERIRRSTADVIGLTDSHELEWHIQSYFLAFKPTALSSIAFHGFINAIVCLGDKDAVIRTYEIKLAAFLRDRGLKLEALFTCADVATDVNRDDKTLFRWKNLIDIGFPFVKVGVLGGAHAEVDSTDWQQILSREGYDVALVEKTLAAVQGSRERISDVASRR